MDATIRIREGTSRAVAKTIRDNPPLVDTEGRWMDRVSAAVNLGVGIRTIDRYIRRGELSAYHGPLDGGGTGVRIWAADVADWSTNHTVKVVAS